MPQRPLQVKPCRDPSPLISVPPLVIHLSIPSAHGSYLWDFISNVTEWETKQRSLTRHPELSERAFFELLFRSDHPHRVCVQARGRPADRPQQDGPSQAAPPPRPIQTCTPSGRIHQDTSKSNLRRFILPQISPMVVPCDSPLPCGGWVGAGPEHTGNPFNQWPERLQYLGALVERSPRIYVFGLNVGFW
ncbi:hypothetical protein DPEC_G00026720 [Dallia pectoralis]|uniref:Uncharacterized protein n=1 Tax=Dallia pectoralis TaxID=75939 RepID=A0ACC2HHK7_DALPE|nr:hypothetical protein DPEC_G00026720 [Dallia pectoralis]